MSRYKPVLLHMEPEEWEVFKEIHECGNLSARIRKLVSRDIDEFTREETKAQSLAGLTEA